MEIINWIKSLLVDYGAINVIIMLLTIFITNLIKKPIVNHAEGFVKNAKKLTGLDVDKSIITSNIVYIPVGVALVLYFIYSIIYSGFNFYLISWTSLISDSLVYGMLSMSIYEIGKAKLKSYVGKKTYNEAKDKINQLNTQTSQGDLLVSEVDTKTETNKAFEEAQEHAAEVIEAVTNIIEENK